MGRSRSVTVVSSNGDVQHFLMPGDNEEYDIEPADFNKMYLSITTLGVIAMCWAYRHPNKAENLFHNPDAIRYLAEGLLPEVAVTPELQEGLSGPAIYSAWLHMAEMLVSRYSEEVGFPKYEDLA